MRTWRVIAVDDEPPALLAIRQALADVQDFTLIASCDDAQAAVPVIERERPDVVLLDIQMPGLTGFELVQELQSRVAPMPAVVFCTAWHEHAIAAFEAQAQDYLLKPLDPARFARTLDLLRRRLASPPGTAHLKAQLRAILTALDAEPTVAPTRYAVRHAGRTVLLDPATIEHLTTDGNVVRLASGRDRYVVRDTLTRVLEDLPAEMFLRVHRGAAVNASRVRAVEPYLRGDYLLHMADGSRIVTGRTYREAVRSAFRLRDEHAHGA
jgi:two-component system, LytTR family, response regulator